MALSSITPTTHYLDLKYLGAEHLIAVGVLESDDGVILVDPGPTSALETLRQALGEAGYALADVRALLLTHIHLDHAGATGAIVQDHPDVAVYVHRLGATHLADPSTLLASARRLYGDMLEPLWGAVVPVPEDALHVLYGDEAITVGGRPFDVAYTPGHAVHHVSYRDGESDTAFIGDTAGMRIAGTDVILPVTPPPDVDLDRWPDSLDAIRNWAPERLFVTHFGPHDDPAWHLDAFERTLDAWSDAVRNALEQEDDEADDAERAEAFHAAKIQELKQRLSPELVPAYDQFGQPQASWRGLARYWRKQSDRASP
jgi:glyoxylase-like metal-dependent hydrolase (beta-lactamase superfamily II)